MQFHPHICGLYFILAVHAPCIEWHPSANIFHPLGLTQKSSGDKLHQLLYAQNKVWKSHTQVSFLLIFRLAVFKPSQHMYIS